MTQSEQLYNSLLNKGYTEKNLGDRDTFLTKMQDKDNRRKLYDFISKRGDFRIGNYENYEQRIASDFSIPQPLQENIALAMANPMDKVDPALRTQSAKPIGDVQASQNIGHRAEMTFNTPEQRSAAQVIADNDAIINSPSLIDSKVSKDPQDAIQQAVSQDLVGKAASQEWQRDTLNSVSGMRDEAKKKIKERAEELRNSGEDFDYSQWQKSPSQYGYAPITTPDVKAPNLHSDREMNLYRLTIETLDEAQKHMETARKNQSRNGFQQAAAGIGDAIFDIDTLTLGLDSLAKNTTLKAILDKADADQPLTQAEESLLNAALYKQFTEAALPNGRWYNIGKGIGENIPYMLQFALSGGVAGALTKGAGKTIGKAVTKYINNLALKNGSKIANTAARNAFTRGSRMLGNGISNLSAGTLKAIAQTPLQTSLYNDIIERQIGTLGYSPSASNSEIGGVAESRGGLQYTGRIDAESTGNAIRNGLASAFITNITEGVGGEGLQFIFNKLGGGIGKGIAKGYTKLTGKQIQSPRFYNRFREAVSKRGLKPMLDAVGFNGAPAEFSEEILDQTLNAIFVGDSSLDPNSENYVFDLDNLIDTAITTGAISLFMGGMGAALSAKVHHDVNKAFAQANHNLEELKYSNLEIQALNDIAIDNPQNTAKWVSSITRTMRTLATSRDEITNSLSPEARQYLDKENPTEEDKKALSLYDLQALTALGEITSRFNELTIQRDYVVAGTNYNAMIQGLKERVAPQAEAELADIQANALRDSDYTVKVTFRGQDGYLVSGTAEINDLPDGSTEATLPAGNIYQVRTKSPDGQWLIQQAIAEDIQPISVTPTQQLIDETTARIYTPVQNLINAEQAQAQAEVAQSTEQTTPTTEQPQPTTPADVKDTIDTTAPNASTQSTEAQPLSDEQFDEHIATLSTSDAINAITQRRGANEADQYAQWRKGILTKERDKAQKALNAKVKPFDASRYPDYAQMKREERKYNEALQATRSEAIGIINRTTAEIADIDRYLANRNRQIAAEREAENPLRNGIAQAVEKQPINTIEQYIARYIALGGRLRMTDQYTNGLAAELGITPGSQEHRELLSILSNTEGMTPEQLAQDMAENIEPEYRHLVAGRDTQDIRNAIINTIQSGVTSRKKAYDFIADINQRAADEEQRYIDEQEQQAEIDADTEQAIREYEELLLPSLTPDDLAIINTMAGDYWDEILAIQQYEQEAYNDYDTNSTSTTPRNTQRGAESAAIQSSTQPSNTTPIRQDSQDTATIRPATPQQNDNGTTLADNEREGEINKQVAQAEAEVNTNPTEAQKEAGNYKKGHIRIGVYDITIEQPQGSIRRGVDANGKAWESKMYNTYGYIRGTEGVDGDHIDVFLANDMDSWNGEQVFVVDQYNEDGTFDEHKVMLGFNDINDAETAYLSNYEKDWVQKHHIVTSATTTANFRKWIDSSHRKTKAFADYKNVETTAGQATEEGGENTLEFNESKAKKFVNNTEKRIVEIVRRLRELLPNEDFSYDYVDNQGNVYKDYFKREADSDFKKLRSLYRNGYSTEKDKEIYSLIQELGDIAHWYYLNKAELNDEEYNASMSDSAFTLKAIREFASTISQATDQVSDTPYTTITPTDSYTITPTQYTTKRGNVLDMQLVKFTNDLTKEQYRTAKELAKADKGWYDREQGGFMMRSQESAQQLADTIASQPISMTDIKALNDGDIAFTEPQQSENKPHAPIWQYSIHVDTDGYTVLTREDVSSGIAIGDAYFSPAADSPEEMLEILRNPHNNMQEVLDAVGVILENRIKTRELDRKIAKQRKQEYEALRANGVNGYKIGEKVIYKGKEATIHDFEEFGNHRPVLDTGMAPVIYEVAEWSDIKKPQQNQSASSQTGQDLTTGYSIDNDAETSAKVVISNQGAKHELNNIIHKYAGQRKTRGFISDLARALGYRSNEPRQTYYFEFTDKQGNPYTLRISNHNVNGENIVDNEKEISIVIKSRRQPNKFIAGNADVREYVYFKESIANGDGQTLAWIAQDIATMLDTGVYEDNSGIAILNTSPTNSTNQGQFNLVSDDRMAELKERLRRKLGGQMNIGIDTEILSIGLEIAVGHIDRGIKSFTDFARVMINDLGDTIRPYLKAFYNGARDLPEVIDNGLATDMTPYDEVQQFDITNFDRTVPDLTATATNIAREAEVTNEVNVAKQRIKRSTEKKKSIPSSSNQLNLFDNTDNNNEDAREQDTRTNNSRTQPRREELPETESVEPRTPLQHTVEIGRSKRGNTRTSGNQLGDRPLYDVNKNYSNEEISQIVSSVTDIVDGRVVITAPITDDIRAICHQYKSGGVAKKGHGILDEYYTDGKIVDAVSMLITPYFNNSNAIRVLEPSVGVGNFISAVDNIPTSEIVTFEINPTTARIAKILYPGIDVNLRSFETEFIDDAGNKKPLPQKYNLIIGNPPYSSHRGLYKGLGEESKIARYEDYFVKRSLDVLNEGGVLAMVLPSSWIDRHTRYGGYTIEVAYRLPSGAFEATQVGTDIVILRKDNSIPTADHTPYFEQYPERVLGEVKQRKGRYGKMEDYVQGDIDTAIEAIKRDHAEQLANRLDITPSNDNLNNIEEAIDETGSLDKATAIVQTAKTEANSPAPSTTTGKKGKYKTVLNRGVETVPTSQQFSHQFSEGEVEAFYETEYDGTINHPSQHRKYANYIGGRAMHDFYYAEGDIYAKLDQLESEKENIIATYGQEQYDKQKRLLMSVLPKRKGLSEITISPNTTFVKNLYIDTDKGSITLRDAFIDFCSKLPYQAFGDSSSWEVRGYVNNEQVYEQDKERNALVRERRKRVANDLFVKFLNEELSQSAQNQVVAAFNREYNSTYRPDYSRVPMFSTINKDFRGRPLKLTSVQLAGIGRMTVKGVGVLAHEVGFGKTLSGILAMHEAMTRGFATKPLVVVPNDNILKQWVETIKEVLPQATVNTLGNLGTSYDLTDFKVNDGEFTLVTYEGLKAMSFSDDTYNRLAERFSYITEDLKKHQSERDIQKEFEKKQELKGRMKRGAKTSYGFEDFGFDWLTVDEVHNCNHIVSKVRLDKSVSSDFRSQNQRTSDLGLKTWLAAQYIQEENNGRNVLLLSATPFTNKPLEYYSILSLVGNKMLKRKGFFHVDQFFSTFMEADNELEIGANGRPTQKTNVRRFRNNGLFQQLLSEFIDIKGEEDNPELVRPDRHNKEYKINPNELTEDAMAAVQDLLNDNDTVLQGIGHARAAAFSPYATSLLGIRPKNHREFVKNSPKINTTIKLIEQNKKDRPDAGQIIYSEVGVEFFPMIRDYLVNESGFKPSEVRIITGATSNAERVNIQSAFNKGDVKVVIGSPAIKEGLNLQENTTDMYILSLPWNFTQLRQIEGRGWRQGNKWENIRINYMLTNNSVDVFMLQRLQLKQGLYNEAMKKGAETLDVSDIDTSELKTALITDPAVRAEIVTKQEREKLEQQRTQIEADLSFVLRKYESYNKLIEKLESKKKEINQFKEWAAGGNSYWADRLLGEENKLNTIVAEIQEEKERLQKKGVNVDDIVLQTEQSQKAIEDINQKIENLKEYQEELADKYRREQELKQQQQGDLLATYIKERKAENNNGSFYKIRPKDSQIRFRSIRPDESLSDYARAVVANSKQTPPPTGLNASVGSRSQEDLELIDAATDRFKEYFNAPEIIQVFSRAQLRKLYRDMTDAEFNERFKEYGKIGAIYDADRDKIYTFVENSENTYVELIHEATHAAIQKLYNSENLKDKLSHFVNEIEKLAPDFCSKLAKAYSGDDYINELTAYTIDEFLEKKSLDDLLSQLSTQAQQELLPILKTIGYEKGRKQQSKQYARIFDTSRKNRPRNGVINDSQTRKESLHSPTDVQDDARKPREREVGVGSPQDNRTADIALDSIEQASADYADTLNTERGAIIDAITPSPDDSPSTVARKVMFRSIGSELVTRDNTELEKFLALANKISNAMADNDARHKHTDIAESQYDSMQRLHNLIDDLRKQGALIDERFDPWLTQNQSRSRAQAETKVFDLTYRQPLYEAIARGIRALFPGINTKDKAENAKGYSHLSLYAQARTAVERQAVKSAQARAEAEEKGEEYKERDFGGLAGIQEAIFGLYSAIDNDVEAAKGNIEKLTTLATERGIPTVQEYIDNAEAKLGNPDTNGTAANQLWTAIRSISAYQLTYSYNAGLVSRSGYQTLTYGRNIDALLRERYNMQVKQIKDNPGSYDNVTDYDKDGNETGKRMVLNDNARIALNKLNQEYAEAIDAVPMPGKNGNWQRLIDTGWLTEEDVNSLHRYYMYYMPLKGHAELTAEDIVDYENKTPRNQSKIKAVEGHSHLAKDPFNQLILDTHGAIQNAEQNRWRTHLYNILTNNPNSSQYVVEQRFYKIETKSDGSKEYVPYGKVETINGAQVFIPGRPTAEELANGTAVSYNNRFTRAEVDIPIRNDQRTEHSVTVMVDGEAYTMFFYDKRIADAINGTNIKRPSDWWKQLDKLQALNRLYAGLKTSLNPTFTLISNLHRDWMEMVSNNFIEHGFAHAVTSFIYRVRATRAGDVQAALRKYQDGKLLTLSDATSDIERYVVEFFNNGGSVNITQLPDYNTAKVELMDDLNTYMRTGEMPKGNAWAIGFNNMAERVELAPRLATYIASRTLGRNISQSVNDAKEATVNFDRKGSWSGIMGMFQLFYNAAAQSVRRQIGLARRHPVRFTATYATIGLLSPLNSIMASYISSLLLGDDDDLEDICRKYFAINPELRRRYFIILIGDDYIRIPMAVNYLPYVTLGDVIANWRLNPNYRPNVLKDTLDIASAILDTFLPSMIAQPLGFFFDTITAKNEQERAQAFISLFGSAFNRIPILEPLGQSIANYNFMGGTLFDRPFDKNSQEPAYLRARQYTQPVWVWTSHLLNDITGGNEVHAGWLNIAPEQIENVMTVFGGYGEYAENIISIGIETVSILSGEKPDTEVFKKSFPLLSRLYGGNTQERYDKSMQSMFYDDTTALAQYAEYRKNATTASTRADFDREYSPDEQRYFADLATMESIAKKIRKEIKAATPEGEAPKYHTDERLKAIYNLANEQYHSLASGEYKPIDNPYYTYMYIKDILEKTPHRTADGTYRLIDTSADSPDLRGSLRVLLQDFSEARSMANALPSGYYPGMPLDKRQEQDLIRFNRSVEKLYNTYTQTKLDYKPTDDNKQ